jgi:hypothetical protein
MAAEGVRPGQSTTDRLLLRHLATGLMLTPVINSLNQNGPSRNVHTTPAMPFRCDRAAQRAQSACAVPVHRPLPWLRSSRTSSRHGDVDAKPPQPSPLVHHRSPTVHRFPRWISEPDPIAAEPTSRRRRPPVH